MKLLKVRVHLSGFDRWLPRKVGPGFTSVCAVLFSLSDLSGMAEDKTCPRHGEWSWGLQRRADGPELRPHSYLDAIRSGLDDLEASSRTAAGSSCASYAAAGECRLGTRGGAYLHGEVCG